MKRNLLSTFLLLCLQTCTFAQNTREERMGLAPTPPMGWMSWNLYGERINEQLIRTIADAPLKTRLRLDTLGFNSSDRFVVRDLWAHRSLGSRKFIDIQLPPHVTAVFRLSQP